MRVQRIQKSQNSHTTQDAVDTSLLTPLIEKYKSRKGNLIPLLQGAQQVYGYIPRQAFEAISAQTGIGLSDMYGVATFYAQFRLNPVGKHIVRVCHGTACHVQDAEKITDALQEALKVKDGETTPDKLFTLESVACLGCCSLAPVMMIGEETFGKLTRKDAVRVINEIRILEKE